MYSWKEWYFAAKKYYEKNGNLRVSATYINEDGMNFVQWISKQRSYYFGKAKRGTVRSFHQNLLIKNNSFRKAVVYQMG